MKTKKMKRALALAGALLLSIGVNGAAMADEADVRAALATAIKQGKSIDAVRRLDMVDWYEIQVGKEVFYADPSAHYIFVGDIIQLHGMRNLTDERKEELTHVKFAELPFERAIKIVKGNGQHVFASFEDPNCGYCKRLAKELEKLSDYTLYTFIVPTLAPDSERKAKLIWCAPDRAEAWSRWMLSKKLPKSAQCEAAFDDLVALSEKLDLSGVPTLLFPDGTRISGMGTASRLAKAIEAESAAAD